MFIVGSYQLAVLLCFVTMLCWGSWGNTQKLAAKTWRYELYYWDYVIGIVLFSLIMGLTLGSFGDLGRSFLPDLRQVSPGNFWSAFTGGVVFNAANILLASAISIAGLAVAFPVGIGLALVLGVLINYISTPSGDPVTLFIGVLLIVTALIINGVAYSKKEASSGRSDRSIVKKGLWISIAAGILMSLFYRFVAAAVDLDHFESPMAGKATPYTAIFIFSLGMLASNFLFNTLLMKRPFTGAPVSYRNYFSGNLATHSVGILGGVIWALGTTMSYITTGQAGVAIAYALGQGATMVAAFWGVFIWKEFRGANRSINIMLLLMFLLFISGLGLIILAGNS